MHTCAHTLIRAHTLGTWRNSALEAIDQGQTGVCTRTHPRLTRTLNLSAPKPILIESFVGTRALTTCRHKLERRLRERVQRQFRQRRSLETCTRILEAWRRLCEHSKWTRKTVVNVFCRSLNRLCVWVSILCVSASFIVPNPLQPLTTLNPKTWPLSRPIDTMGWP